MAQARLSRNVRGLLCKLLAYIPHQRPNMQQARSDAWFTSGANEGVADDVPPAIVHATPLALTAEDDIVRLLGDLTTSSSDHESDGSA